jgi:hypothetical protein
MKQRDPGPGLPYYNPGLKIDSPEYRLAQKRYNRNRGGYSEFIPTNPFTTPHTPMRPAVGFGTVAKQLTSPRPWCGTNQTHVDPYIGQLIGSGANPAEIDSVSQVMRRSRFTPNANKSQVALRQLAALRTQQANGGAMLMGGTYANTPGVINCALPPVAVFRQDTWANRQSQRPGRGVIRQSDMRLPYINPGIDPVQTAISYNSDNNGGSNN